MELHSNSTLSELVSKLPPLLRSRWGKRVGPNSRAYQPLPILILGSIMSPWPSIVSDLETSMVNTRRRNHLKDLRTIKDAPSQGKQSSQPRWLRKNESPLLRKTTSAIVA